MTKPVFIISPPRAGSTLLQRILMQHPDLASCGEPWLLLPIAHLRSPCALRSIYGHHTSVRALENLISELPYGEDDFYECLRQYPQSVYDKLSGGKEYFLDKTPRYYLILPQLQKMFPEARIIIILRNPLSLLASTIEAMGRNSLRRFDGWIFDLENAPIHIGNVLDKGDDRIHCITYEELITQTASTINNLASFLYLSKYSFDTENLNKVTVSGLGDHKRNDYKTISNQSEHWKKIIDSPTRKRFASNFIKNVPEKYLDAGGYVRDSILESVYKHKPKRIRPFEPALILQTHLIRQLKCRLRLSLEQS